MTPAHDFSGPGWRSQRESWNEHAAELRRYALTDIAARSAWVPADLIAAWDVLARVLDEVEARELARDFELWRRVCKTVQAMRDAAEEAEEFRLARVLNDLLVPAILFARQCQKDEDERQRWVRRRRG